MTARSNAPSKTRHAIVIFLFLAIAVTAWLLTHEAMEAISGASYHDAAFNPGYQHSQRLQVATARAAMDVVGMTGTDPAADSYRADYQLQRIQIQADSEGLERWAMHDTRHQGLLLEIRSSLAGLLIALDQTSGSAAASSGSIRIPLLPALNRAHNALSNYSASLTEPTNLQTAHYLLAGPVLLWWFLILLLMEVAVLAWLVFAKPSQLQTA